MTTKTYDELYYEALAADKAWQAELEQVYGKDAVRARYDDRGQATPKLHDLKAEFLRANIAKYDAL